MARPPVDVSGILEPPPGLDPDCLLFLGDPERKTSSVMARLWMPVSAAVCLGIGSIFTNVAVKLPIRAGLHKHVINVILGGLLGEGAYRYRDSMTAERDLQYYHYMIMHPEDFQAPERKTYGQVLKPWVPVR